MKKKPFLIFNKSSAEKKKKQAHVYIYGDIANFQDKMATEFGLSNVSQVKDILEANKDADQIIVHIHSRGGDVSEGFAIHDLLTSSGKEIITQIEGLCASIATVVALSGTTRRMTKNSDFFIHNPWTFGEGDADELRKRADEVQAAEDKLKNFYHDKTGVEITTLDNLMKEETTLSADQALEMKFVTEIVEEQKAYAIVRDTKPKSTDPSHSIQTQSIQAMKTLTDALKTLNSIFSKNGIKNEGDPDPVKALDLTTADGKTVHVETEAEAPKVGDVVSVDGAATPDASYTLEDGSVIKTDADSKISEITPAEEEDSAEAMKALKDENKNIAKELADLKAKRQDDEKLYAELNKKLGVLAKSITSKHTPTPDDPDFGSAKVKGDAVQAMKDKLKKYSNRHKPEPAKK